ncbi:MAG TPA: hypothetical protein VJH92_03090 [Candidatus Nanoarchaeia archaeon]|nr:hypothetical protein [Candidatus Nanoarchaeia archaeon]
MNAETRRLREGLDKAKRDYEESQRKLNDYVSSCPHKFGEVEYAPIYQKGYEIPGDKPGTMGSDWRGPMWVSPETTPRWRKECNLCGLVKETTQTQDKVEKIPKW